MAPGRPPRVTSIDALRGAVMVVMALDHVRDFIHRGAMTGSPTDLAQTSFVLFMTRWVTHICAPTFVFAAGLGAWLWWQQHGGSRPALARFLVTRGLWLILLEVTVMRLAYNFTWSTAYPLLLIVLWVLGASMVVLAATVWMPARVLATVALATIALHNLLDPVRAGQFGSAAGVWNVLHQVGAFPIGGVLVIVAYPLIPWAAVMALGLASGPIFGQPAAERQRLLMRAGLAAVIGFVALRATNQYGDPAPWSVQPSGLFTALSFLNTTKYPPSLSFLLMTLGPAWLALAWLDRRGLPASHPLVVFGRAPLFYFVAHFFLAHAVAAALSLARYGSAAWAFIFNPVPSMGGPRQIYPPDFGYDLWVAYLVWILIVLALYPACRAVARWKAENRTWWVSYL